MTIWSVFQYPVTYKPRQENSIVEAKVYSLKGRPSLQQYVCMYLVSQQNVGTKFRLGVIVGMNLLAAFRCTPGKVGSTPEKML